MEEPVGSSFSNPWIITTLWLSQYLILKAKDKKELEEAKKWIDWVKSRALPSGVLPEQVDPYSGFAVSATPLGWSHVEFITTILMYLEKLKSFK